jgi:hypothetical protein
MNGTIVSYVLWFIVMGLARHSYTILSLTSETSGVTIEKFLTSYMRLSNSYLSINNLSTTTNRLYHLKMGNLETLLSNIAKVRVYSYDGQIFEHDFQRIRQFEKINSFSRPQIVSVWYVTGKDNYSWLLKNKLGLQIYCIIDVSGIWSLWKWSVSLHNFKRN